MPALPNGQPSTRRAHRWLILLILIMILTAGAITATVTAPPSPLVGVSFGVSSIIFGTAFILAGRITIALERVRRSARPPQPETNPYPLFSKLLRRR